MSMTGSPGTTPGQGTTDVAREQARQVGQTATQAAGQVAQTSAEQAREVVSEASAQARDLAGQARSQLQQQASSQQNRLADSLRSIGDELDQLVSGGGASGGVASDLLRQAQAKVQDAAAYLESREPGDLLEDLRSFARQRPGTFLLGAALAGVVAGRLTRGAIAARQGDGGDRLPVPSTTATAVDTGDYVGPGVDETIDLTTGTAAGSAHGISAEGVREPTTGPLAPGGGYGEPERRDTGGQGWSV